MSPPLVSRTTLPIYPVSAEKNEQPAALLLVNLATAASMISWTTCQCVSWVSSEANPCMISFTNQSCSNEVICPLIFGPVFAVNFQHLHMVQSVSSQALGLVKPRILIKRWSTRSHRIHRFNQSIPMTLRVYSLFSLRLALTRRLKGLWSTVSAIWRNYEKNWSSAKIR